MAEGDNPFNVFERIGDNVYKLELPANMKVSATFNIGDLAPYIEVKFENLRANPAQEGEVDAN